MARTRYVEFTVKVTVQGPGFVDLDALLDQLRYEGGQVQSWDRSNDGRAAVYTLRLKVEETHYARRRWASFGIHPTDEHRVVD